MKKLVIPTDPRHAMEAISVGAGSCFECVLMGADPRYTDVCMTFGTTAYKVAAKSVPGGEWRVLAPSEYFPDENKTNYHVTAKNGDEDVYLGGGTCFVLPAIPEPEQPTPQ